MLGKIINCPRRVRPCPIAIIPVIIDMEFKFIAFAVDNALFDIIETKQNLELGFNAHVPHNF